MNTVLYVCFVLKVVGQPVSSDNVRCVPAPQLPPQYSDSQPYRVDPRLGGRPYATPQEMQEYQRAEAKANEIAPKPTTLPTYPNY